MADLTRDEVVAALGSIDDNLVAEILATGASAEEFIQARAWLSTMRHSSTRATRSPPAASRD
jgi:hypothetical protein